MRKKSTPELDKLYSEVETYSKSEEYEKLFEFIKKFRHIAPYNAMLIHIQKPGSRYVATAAEWRRKFNRTIKAGARPLVILYPFGPVAFVFELSDTEGKRPFPEKMLNPLGVKGKVENWHFSRLKDNIKADGINYREVEYGTARGGSIQISQSGLEQSIMRNGKEIRMQILYDIVTNSNNSLETKFSTIVHELGHLYCGHLGTFYPKWWSDRRSLSKNQREFEAESVCWLVCERLGIKNPSAEYLSGYLDNNENIPIISIDTVLKSASIIEKMIKGTKAPRKEIIVKSYESK
jgi:hypothetical protein